MRRAARLGGMVVGAVAMFATLAPPASAIGVGAVVFQGIANVTTGLGAPVVTGGTPGVVVDPTPGKKGLVTVTGGNTRTGTFASTLCLGAKVMVLKNKPPLVPGVPASVNGPLCTIGATFVVSGFCGLSSGAGTGTATATTPAVIPANTISFNFTWVDPGTQTMIILGNWWQGTGPKPFTPDGDLVAFAKVTPAFSGLPPTESCLVKTQQNFTIAGVGVLMHPKVLPS